VFDNHSGDIVSQCHASGPMTGPVSLADCTAVAAWTLSGSVRRSDRGAADAAQASDPPLPLAVELELDGAAAAPRPTCVSEAQKLVAGGRRPRRAACRGAARCDTRRPGPGGWTELDDRFVAYHCGVSSLQGAWSGRSVVVPQGWRIGSATGEFKVCRYAADRDGSGAVDQNDEHPNEYHHVDHPLMQQNFLLVPGPLPCPSPSTVQHQP
jgi:hypothetical protein